MGRHSMDYRPESDTTSPQYSIAPPGGPIDPGVPGAPDAPGAPGPEAPSTVPPVEPPPFAPEEVGDGSVPTPSGWQDGGPDFL